MKPTGRRIAALVIAFGLASAGSRAADAPSDEAESLVARERLRARVETLLAEMTAPTDPHDDHDHAHHAEPLFAKVGRGLVALGPDVAPFLRSEIEGKSRTTFHVAAYALGALRLPETKEVLRTAAEVADREGGEFGRDRKVWLAYALAVAGDPEALDLLDVGAVNATRKEFFRNLTILEVVSMLTAPGSRPRLLERLDRYAGDPALQDRLHLVLNALRQVADRSIVPKVLPFLDHELPYVRDAAARALAASRDTSVLDRLIAKLDDPMAFSRFGIASAIEELRPKGKSKALLARLDADDNSAVRGALYRALVAADGESAIEPLVRRWGRADGLDRFYLVDAVARAGGKKGLNLFRTALRDPDTRVVLRAIDALANSEGAGPRDTIIALFRDPRSAVELQAIESLVRVGERRAAPRIVDRLRGALARPIGDPSERDAIRARADALVRLRDASALPVVRQALSTQTDLYLIEDLRLVERKLAALEERKDDPDLWTKALASTDPDVRRLARERVAELAAPTAAAALVDSFGRVDVAEGREVLRSLARLASPEASPLAERVLLDPAFDEAGRAPLRAMAAWAARRIGGPGMIDALRRAAERRDGQELDVLVALALLAGREALPTLDALRAPRMRHYDYLRGPEMERLSWIARELREGRSIASLDFPPDEVALH